MRDGQASVQEAPDVYTAVGSWELAIDIPGNEVIMQGGPLDEDEFMQIVGDGRSSVNITVGMNVPYGDVKVTVGVRLTCNQDEATIDKASTMAYTKALSLCKDGLMYGAQERAKLLGSLPTTRG